MLAVPRPMVGAPLRPYVRPASACFILHSRASLHTTAATAAQTARAARNRSKAPRQKPVRMLRPATDGVPEFRRVPGIAAENAHAGARRITDVVEWSKSPLVSLGVTNDPHQLTRAAKVFRRVPVRPGFTKLLTELIHARNSLRVDVHPDQAPPIQPTSIQRLAFQHFLVERDEQTLVPRSTRARLFSGAPGWLFPKAPGSSTLLAGETGGGKTVAYLLPLLERLVSTQKEDLQKEFGLRDKQERSDARAAHFAAEAAKELDEYDEPEPEWVEDPEDMLMSERQPHKEPQHWLTGEELEDFEAFLKSAERSQGTEQSRAEAYKRYERYQIEQAEVAAWTPPSKPEVPFLVRPRSIILAPSHELARQIESSVKSLTHIEKLRTLCTSRNDWRKALEHDIRLMSQDRWEEVRPIDVLVTTPERLLDLVTPLKVRNARYQALHNRYLEGEDFVAARMLEKHVERDIRRQLISLDAVRAVVCDEADNLWDEDHMVATRAILRSVYDDRLKGWKEGVEPRPLVPADLIHVTASVGAGFKKQLTTRWPDTKYILSKGLHQLPTSLRVKFANVGPTRHMAFAREVRDALLADPTDRSRVVVFCDRRHTVKSLSLVLNRVGILNTTLTSDTKERSQSSNNHLAGFVLDPRTLLRAPPKAQPAEEAQDAPATSAEGAEQDESAEQYEPVGEDLEEVAKQLELAAAERDGTPKERVLRAYKRHDEKLAAKPAREAARQERREQRRQLGSALPRPVELQRDAKGQKFRSQSQRLVPLEEKPGMLNPYAPKGSMGADKANYPRVLITTSLLARGIDFSPLVTHLMIPDTSAATRAELDTPERHAMSTMDLLHRAGRVARGGAPATLVLFDKTAALANRPTLKHNGRFRGYKLGRIEGAVRSLRPLGVGRDGPATKRALRNQKFSRGAARKQAKEKKEIGF